MIARADDLVVSASGWARFRGWRGPCAIGRSGVVAKKVEGDGASPIGVFRFERVLFRPDRVARPRSAAPLRPIRLDDGWSDDPADPLYNRPIRRPRAYGHERLRRADPLYDLIVVFDANRAPIRPGAGSALFLHVWRAPRAPTAGCVAFPRARLLWIIERLTPRSRLVIHAGV